MGATPANLMTGAMSAQTASKKDVDQYFLDK